MTMTMTSVLRAMTGGGLPNIEQDPIEQDPIDEEQIENAQIELSTELISVGAEGGIADLKISLNNQNIKWSINEITE